MEGSSPGGGNSHAEGQSSEPTPPAKRKRPSKDQSSRGVANLTPEQLARKRANDREAQRAIRERTKNQIDTLLSRIRELESQQPYNDLQVVLREKEAIQAENEDIKRRLSGIWNIVQPILDLRGLNDLAVAAGKSQLPNAGSAPQPITVRRHPYPESDPRSSHNPYPSAPGFGEVDLEQASATVQADEDSEVRSWSVSGLAPNSNIRGSPRNSPQLSGQRSPRTSEAGFGQSDERLGVNFLLDGDRHLKIQNGAAQGQQIIPPLSPHNEGFGAARPAAAYAALPLMVKPVCTLDYILLDFLGKRRVQAAHGASRMELVGPSHPNFTALVYPDRNVEAHPLSKLFTDIVRTFPDISRLPEQVAIIHVMFLLMRWEIEPTRENYDLLPEWMTPRPSQLFTPHPAWMDHLPWPRLRDRMVEETPFQPFEGFFVPFTTTVSLNWPYNPQDCLLAAPGAPRGPSHSTPSGHHSAPSPFSTGAASAGSPQTPAGGAGVSMQAETRTHSAYDEQWVLNPAFETHLRDLTNWSLGPAFRNTFPHLADAVRIKEDK